MRIRYETSLLSRNEGQIYGILSVERAPGVRFNFRMEETAVETYITLGNFTHQGATNLKESPGRIDAARKAVEASGGKWLGWYLTMGQYDFVVITQAPNANIAATVLLAIGAQGNASTQTLRAFTEEEFSGMVSALP